MNVVVAANSKTPEPKTNKSILPYRFWPLAQDLNPLPSDPNMKGLRTVKLLASMWSQAILIFGFPPVTFWTCVCEDKYTFSPTEGKSTWRSICNGERIKGLQPPTSYTLNHFLFPKKKNINVLIFACNTYLASSSVFKLHYYPGVYGSILHSNLYPKAILQHRSQTQKNPSFTVKNPSNNSSILKL